MGIVRKIVAKVDAKADKVVAEKLEQADVKPAPKKVPPKADSSVVSPTPLSGGCALRVLQVAGFAGVVAVTASAALVGRCRR